MGLRPGALVNGRFHLEREIGRGGSSEVWLARDDLNAGDVALKVLSGGKVTLGAKRQFTRETRALARFTHPHASRLIDSGWLQDEGEVGHAFIALNFVSGIGLNTLLKQRSLARQPFAPHEVADLACMLASALGAAHDVGIIHRDVKPSNVVVSEQGEAMTATLVDFGLARAWEPASESTTHGRIMGTPLYSAPELVRGLPSFDRSIDVFGLGIIVYEMLTMHYAFARGEADRPLPFDQPILTEHNARIDILERILRLPLPRVSALRPELGDSFDAFVRRCLAREPSERPQTTADFVMGLLDALKASEDQGPLFDAFPQATTKVNMGVSDATWVRPSDPSPPVLTQLTSTLTAGATKTLLRTKRPRKLIAGVAGLVVATWVSFIVADRFATRPAEQVTKPPVVTDTPKSAPMLVPLTTPTVTDAPTNEAQKTRDETTAPAPAPDPARVARKRSVVPPSAPTPNEPKIAAPLDLAQMSDLAVVVIRQIPDKTVRARLEKERTASELMGDRERMQRLLAEAAAIAR